MAKGKKTGGRVKGTPNKVTTAARELLTRAADALSGELEGWIRQTAAGVPMRDKRGKQLRDIDGHPLWVQKPSPHLAATLVVQAAEYAVPKLSRAVVVGDPGQPLVVNFPNLPRPGPSKE